MWANVDIICLRIYASSVHNHLVTSNVMVLELKREQGISFARWVIGNQWGWLLEVDESLSSTCNDFDYLRPLGFEICWKILYIYIYIYIQTYILYIYMFPQWIRYYNAARNLPGICPILFGHISASTNFTGSCLSIEMPYCYWVPQRTIQYKKWGKVL